MKRKNCLKADIGVIKPPFRRTPENSWLLAYKSKLIPESLYKFYVAADYFSFDKCPEFLNDNKKLLFPHLGTSVDLIKSSFEEYPELLDLMKEYDSKYYTPFKKIRGESFDPFCAEAL